MKVELTACDNPHCDKTTDDRYGWVTGTLCFHGPGPEVNIEVCSAACLDDGFTEAVERWYEEESRRTSEQHSEVRNAVFAQVCPTCGAEPGKRCRALASRKDKLTPHAKRRDAGFAALADKK